MQLEMFYNTSFQQDDITDGQTGGWVNGWMDEAFRLPVHFPTLHVRLFTKATCF